MAGVGAAAVVWFVLAAVLAVAELATLTLALGLAALAAAAAGIAAVLGAALAVQVAVFAGGAALLLAGVRPVVTRHLRTASTHAPTGTEAMRGLPAVVTRDLSSTGGQVEVRGELWSARLALPEGPPLPAGTRVTIATIDGATAVVYPT